MLPVLLIAVLLAGCVATQKDVLELENQADQLKEQVSILQKNQADAAVKMDQLHQDLSAFTEHLKDSQGDMRRLSTKLEDLQAVLGQKIENIGDTITKQKEHEAQALKSPTPSQIYHSATLHLAKKNYDLAIQGFSVYLEKFPKGEVADLAHFHLGESYYGKKSWEEAAKAYATVLDRFPKSDLTPSARLKYAYCLMNLKQNTPEAKRYLESILEDFPRSPEAKTAKAKLDQLEKPKPPPKTP